MVMQELIEALRLRLEEMKCPGCNGSGLDLRGAIPQPQGGPCGTCHGTGGDPAYTELLEVVRKKCFCHGIHEDYHHEACDGQGYYTRSWLVMPKGALAGSIVTAVENMSGPKHWKMVDKFWALFSPGESVLEGWSSPDPDLAALTALSEALGVG